MDKKKYDLCIIGGGGHVGLPLGVAFANAGVRTVLLDLNRAVLAQIEQGVFPFLEDDGPTQLRAALARGTLATSGAGAVIGECTDVISVIGTPVDEHLNPDLQGILKSCDEYFEHFQAGQMLVLRSTIYPGTTERVQRYFRERGQDVRVAFCPERIAEGKAFAEFKSLAQIVSACDPDTERRAAELFRRLTDQEIITVPPEEAELAKLFSNAWRYITFAAVNQFYMMAADHGLDFHRIYRAMTQGYPRNQHMPTPGFAAGPCLRKDTLQLVTYHNSNFLMGYDAMLINEMLPNYLLQTLRTRYGERLKTMTIGILGMAFKAGSDDARESLSYKLRKQARFECGRVLCHDVHIKDPGFVTLDELLQQSDVIILATPHAEYRQIKPADHPGKEFLDIRNIWPSQG